MTLLLALGAHKDSGLKTNPSSVFMGTGWGALSETYDFLTRLTDSKEQFPGPTDFIGSVHNWPASQVAIMFDATGANITTSGGDYSFEQALLAADLLMEDTKKTALVLGADEGHDVFSPLLDPSIAPGTQLADGGGAFCLSRKKQGARCSVRVPFYQSSATDNSVDSLIDSLGGLQDLQTDCALVLAGIPVAVQEKGEPQLEQFMKHSGLSAPAVRYRGFTGEFASASAVAAVMAVSFLESGKVPGKIVSGEDIALDTKNSKILVLGLWEYISAMDFSRP